MAWFRSVCLCVLLMPFGAAAQQAATPTAPAPAPAVSPSPAPQSFAPGNPAAPPAPAAASKEITLYVQVTDKSGAQVRGLTEQDFTLLDNKQPQPIASFRAVNAGRGHGAPDPTNPPIEVIMVVDAVNVEFHVVAYERGQIRNYLLSNGGELEYPTSLALLTDNGPQIQRGYSQDGHVLAALYDKLETGLRTVTRSQGVYGAEDRFGISLSAISGLASFETTQPGRKILIWISPGWPLLSGPEMELSKKDEEQLFRSIVGFSTGLQRARITLDAIDPLGLADAGGLRVDFYKEFLNGVKSPSNVLPGDLALQVMAVHSGGIVINSTNDLASAIARCAADADAYYILTFDPPTAAKPDEYHSLEVKVDKPKLTARTRTGYYSQP
ncbi:MAG TPA: VWA domain-containing protein [Verrucomicrobiae bacterium]|nr:VWA domain-containing protein [Verrucomicrobiae bacterium]